MGSRLSQPRGPAGTTESSVPTRVPPPPSPKNPLPQRPFNSRKLIAPAAAATMALLLFVYARTSIRAAKANAQRHRDADTGGSGLSLLNEHRRRHGMADKVAGEGSGTVVELGRQLLGRAPPEKEQVDGTQKSLQTKDNTEERLRAVIGKKG